MTVRGARQHRHLERSCVPVWGVDGNRSHDTLSREISRRNAAHTSRGGDCSTPLRYGRNDGGCGRLFYNLRPLKGKRLTTFCVSLCSGGRRLAVRTAMEHPIGALPRTPFPASRDFPSRGNERYEGKNSESYTSCTTPAVPPLVAGATTFPPQAGALWMLSHGAMSLQENIERPILPPEQGEVRRSPDRGWRAQRANQQNCFHAI